MGTKNNPGKFDCYHAAEPDEPMFVLLARDPQAPNLVREWANLRRLLDLKNEDAAKVEEATMCADAMEAWFREHRPDKLKEWKNEMLAGFSDRKPTSEWNEYTHELTDDEGRINEQALVTAVQVYVAQQYMCRASIAAIARVFNITPALAIAAVRGHYLGFVGGDESDPVNCIAEYDGE